MPNVFDEIESEEAPKKKNVFDEVEEESSLEPIKYFTSPIGIPGYPRLPGVSGIQDSISGGGFAPVVTDNKGDSVGEIAKDIGRRFIADPAISLLKGAIAVPEAAVGLADIVTGGGAGKALEAGGYGFRPKVAKEFLEDLYSPEQKLENAAVQDAKGFLPTIEAYVKNPSTIAHSIVESLPAMGGGAAVARKVISSAPKIGALIGGALGEGVVGAGQAAESSRQQNEDGLLTPKQAALALSSGAITGLVGIFGGKVAKKLGVDDIDSLVAGAATSAERQSLAKQIAKSFVSEGVLEEMPQSALEQIQSNIANGKPWNEGVSEAAAQGLVTGGVMGAGANVISGQKTDTTEADQNQATLDAAAAEFNKSREAEAGRDASFSLSEDDNPKFESIGNEEGAKSGFPSDTPDDGVAWKKISIPGSRLLFEESDKAVWIIGLETEPNERRKGKATKLLQEISDYAKKTGRKVYHGTYTEDGEKYLKHINDRIENQVSSGSLRAGDEFSGESRRSNDNQTAEGPGATPATISPEVSRFITDFQDPKKRVTNASDDPSVTTTQGSGLGVKTLDDLKALAALDKSNKDELRAIKEKSKSGQKLTPEETARYMELGMKVQFPREVIETATNSGSWSEENQSRVGKPLPARPLDWKKNPEIKKWLQENGEALGIKIEEAPTPVESMEDFRARVTAERAASSQPVDTKQTSANIPYGQQASTAAAATAVSSPAEGVEAGRQEDSGEGPRKGSVPNQEVISASDRYTASVGLPPIKKGLYAKVKESVAKAIAAAYDALPVFDEKAVPAFRQLEKEINAQWDHAVNDLGITFESWTEPGQPYANSEEMTRDIRENNHLYFFQGGEPHPLFNVPDQNGITANDKLRAIHDLYGHAAEDFQFGPRGEENAWIKHSQMFSPLAQQALTTETRGQNSWVNFGSQNYEGQTRKNINPKDRPYAVQKVALLPSWATRFDTQQKSANIPYGQDSNTAAGSEGSAIPTDSRAEASFAFRAKGAGAKSSRPRTLTGKARKLVPGERGGRVTISHWSNSDLTKKKIDPKYHGKGIQGAERTRKSEYPDDFQARSYYGLSGYLPEQGLGPKKHDVEINADHLYDYKGDPDNIYEKAQDEAEKRFPRHFGERYDQAVNTIYERLISEAGYVGYYNGDFSIAAVFKALPGSGKADFSTQSTQRWDIPEPVSRDAVREAVSRLQKEFPAGLPVVVVNTYHDLPDSLHQIAYRQGANPAGINGAVTGSTVYIVSDNLSSVDEARQIWLHEQAGHFATDEILGNKLNDFMQQVHDSFKDSELMQDTRSRYKNADSVRLGREFVARLSENPQADPSAWNKLVVVFRQFLRDIGWVKTVSENDIQVLLSSAMSKLRSGGDVDEDSVSFSINSDPGLNDDGSEQERKATQGRFFTGDYTATDRENQKRDAQDFIVGSSDSEVIDLIAQFASGKSVEGLSQQNVSATIAAVMKRMFAKIGTSKNPAEVAELWRLMDRAKSLAQQEGSVVAQTLEARKVFGEELGFMSPILAFRGLAQKAWAKAFGLPEDQNPETVFEGITKSATKEAGSGAVKKLVITNEKIRSILNKVAKEGGINWSELFLDESRATQKERREHLLAEIRKHPQLQDLTPEQSVILENALSKAWDSARMDVFKREFSKRIKLPTVEAGEKLFKKVLPELIRQANLGTLDDSAFLNAFAKELGLPSLTGEAATKLTKLAQEAQTKPEGVLRNKILQQMIDVIQQTTPAHPLDIVRDYWYNNALSGTRTLTAILTGSWIHGAIMAAQQAMDAAILKRRPGTAGRILQAFLSDSLEGVANGWDVFRTGDYTRRAEFSGNINRMLSGQGKLDSLEGWLKHGNNWQKALGLTSYVRRAVVGLDYVGAIGTRGAGVIYNAMLDNPEQLQKAMARFDKEKSAQAKKQAQAELGPDAKWVDVRARQLEILESGIDQQVKDNATVLGEIAALNAQPVGWGGVVYRLLEAMPRAIQSGTGSSKPAAAFSAFVAKTAVGLAFARAAINMTQSASNWMPVVGGVNYARALAGKKIPEGHWARVFGVLDSEGKPLTDDRRRLIAAAQVSGLALAAIAYAMTRGGDDEEDKFDVSGSWYGLTPQQRKDKMASGERPLSIRVGGRWINYGNLPFGGALAMIGNMRDKERKDGKRMSSDESITRMVDAWASGLFYIKDLSVISGLSRTLGISAMNTDESASALNRLVAQQAGNAAGLIPFNSTVREIDTFFDPNVYKPTKGLDYWVRGIPFVRRTVGEGPEYNMAGLPVENMLTPQSRLVAPSVKRDPVVSALSSLIAKGAFPHHPDPAPTWVKNGQQLSAKDLPKESYEYQIQVLKRWREVMLVDAEYLKTVTPEEYESYFKETLAPIRDEVKMETQEKIDPEALDSKGKVKKEYRK